jgi:hypothetical protein
MLAYRGIWSEAWPGVNLAAAGLPFLGTGLLGLFVRRARLS